MWDEIYCQLVKQTLGNTLLDRDGFPSSMVKGFELLTLCAGTFQCTSGLYPYIMSHLQMARKHRLPVAGAGIELRTATKRIATLARRAQVRLQKTQQMRQRQKVPTDLEAAAVLAARPVMVRVYLLDGSHKTLPMNTHTTASDMCSMMAMMLKISSSNLYAVYEYDEAGDKHFLRPETRVMDVIAMWQEAALEDKGAVRRGDLSAHFNYEVHYFLDVPEADPVSASLVYIQAVANVVKSRYPATKRLCLDLAALQLQAERQVFNGEGCVKVLRGTLHRYMPARFIDGDGAAGDVLTEHLVRRWKRLQEQGYDAYECQLCYLELLQQSIWYGTQMYKMMPMLGNNDFPAGGIWFAVARTHIIVVDCESSVILETIMMDRIIKHGSAAWSEQWGGSLMKLLVGNIVKQRPVKVVSVVPGEADEIIDLIRVYQSNTPVSTTKAAPEPEEQAGTAGCDGDLIYAD